MIILGCLYFFFGGFFARVTYKHHIDRDSSKRYAWLCAIGAAFLAPIILVMGVYQFLRSRPTGEVYSESEVA